MRVYQEKKDFQNEKQSKWTTFEITRYNKVDKLKRTEGVRFQTNKTIQFQTNYIVIFVIKVLIYF